MFLENAYTILRGCTVEIPSTVGTVVSLIYLVIKIGIPIILLIVGMVDLGKAVVAQKEDEIKKAQGLLVKKLVAAALVFFLFTLIQFAINLVDNNNDTNASMWSCVNVILGGEADENVTCPKAYKPVEGSKKLCQQKTCNIDQVLDKETGECKSNQ